MQTKLKVVFYLMYIKENKNAKTFGGKRKKEGGLAFQKSVLIWEIEVGRQGATQTL